MDPQVMFRVRARSLLLTLVLLLIMPSLALAEELAVVWQSLLSAPAAVAVDPGNGSVWVADRGVRRPGTGGRRGAAVVRLSGGGALQWRGGSFSDPCAIGLNPSDGSCWIGDRGAQEVIHISPAGQELWRGGPFVDPASVAVDPTDGSCWVVDRTAEAVVHLRSDGTEAWRTTTLALPKAVAVDPSDGSCWVAAWLPTHLAPDGTILWQEDLLDPSHLLGATAVAVDPRDGSCFLARGVVRHIAASGAFLWQHDLVCDATALAVDTGDGSCWAVEENFSYSTGALWWFSEDGTQARSQGGYDGLSSVSVDPRDGSCWVSEANRGHLLHIAADGTELRREVGFATPVSVTVNQGDGSVWIADKGGDPPREAIVHLNEDGAELWRGQPYAGGARVIPRGVACNSRDGSCWAVDGFGAGRLLAGGATAWWWEPSLGFTSSVCADTTDDTGWVGVGAASYFSSYLQHFTAAGTSLGTVGPFHNPDYAAVSPADGSLWVSDIGHWDPDSQRMVDYALVHLSRGGTVLWRNGTLATSTLAVLPSDGSCWAAGDPVLRVSAAGGVMVRTALVGPIAANVGDGSCWAMDRGRWDEDEQRWVDSYLVHLSPVGAELARLGGPSVGSRLAVDPRDGSCWVADASGGRVIHVAVYHPRFTDVHASYWAFAQIEACAAAGVVTGYADDTYRPALPVARDAMAVFVSRALAGGDANVPAGPLTATFPDVPTSYWAYKYVEYAVDHGVVGGYPDRAYRPAITVTRDQMAAFIARAMAGGDPNVPSGPSTAFFPDVPMTHWAFRYVEYVHDQGVVAGYWDGTYRPELVVDRGTMAVYVQRAFALPM